METVVIALGGNALISAREKPSIQTQEKNIRKTLLNVFFLFQKHRAVLTFGNGPQVGNILLQVESALGKAYSVPLEVAVAESQGEIGFLLSLELVNLFSRRKLKKNAVSILTQVVVGKNDPAFQNPSKPVGPFYSKTKALQLKRKGFSVNEDSGRGWRRVVPSPMPVEIVEKNTIRQMLAKNTVVIAAGGGGIPVIKEKGLLKGVAAVIDKDLASARLALDINADKLLVLTGVDSAFLFFGTKKQKPLGKVSVKEAKKFLAQGHFGKGSMEPKIRAAVQFVEKSGGTAIITSPKKLKAALYGKAGTIVS